MWYDAFWAGVFPLIGAGLLNGARLVQRPVVMRAATDVSTVAASHPAPMPLWVQGLATLLLRFSAVFLAAALVLRPGATGRPPFSNMWEYLVAVNFWIAGLHGYA